MFLPFSPLGLAIQVTGVLLLVNLLLKRGFRLFGNREAAERDYSEILATVFIGRWMGYTRSGHGRSA